MSVLFILTSAAMVMLSAGQPPIPPLVDTNCSNGPAHPALASSSNTQLQKLSEYEALCKGAVVDQLMLFAPMPTSQQTAAAEAADMAGRLREFVAQNIAPLVVFEPPFTSKIVLKSIRGGNYDAALNTYYQALKSQGLSDEQLGTWVLFPEANTPVWHTTNADDFVANVAKVGQLHKQYFPKSKLSIMLNAQSYPDNDDGWNNGSLKSLLPYVKNLPTGLIDSFGYQGFPWVSPANAQPRYEQTTPSLFLPANLAEEAARALGVKQVWLNTGSINRIYATSAEAVTFSVEQRRTMLQAVLDQAVSLQTAGFAVSINLFAENKLTSPEQVDWSYWPAAQYQIGPSTEVLQSFVHNVRAAGMGFSLFDS